MPLEAVNGATAFTSVTQQSSLLKKIMTLTFP